MHIIIDTEKIVDRMLNSFNDAKAAMNSGIQKVKHSVRPVHPAFTLDETDNFDLHREDTIEVASLKMHARFWKEQAMKQQKRHINGKEVTEFVD